VNHGFSNFCNSRHIADPAWREDGHAVAIQIFAASACPRCPIAAASSFRYCGGRKIAIHKIEIRLTASPTVGTDGNGRTSRSVPGKREENLSGDA
jgi:hypothetical protein